MNYELGRQLREAGYEGYLHFESEGYVTYDLEELVNALGNVNLEIRLYPANYKDKRWITQYIGSGVAVEPAPTVGEAVAKLYLKLKSNPHSGIANN